MKVYQATVQPEVSMQDVTSLDEPISTVQPDVLMQDITSRDEPVQPEVSNQEVISLDEPMSTLQPEVSSQEVISLDEPMSTDAGNVCVCEEAGIIFISVVTLKDAVHSLWNGFMPVRYTTSVQGSEAFICI